MRYPAKKPTRRLPVGDKHAVIDADDVAHVSAFRWQPGGTNNRYAVTFRRGNGTIRTLYLHRVIMDAKPGEIVDHVDGNPLNNTRENLRIVSRSENAANMASTKSRTGFRNVCRYRKSKPFRASVQRDGAMHHGPYRATAEEAAHDADDLLRRLYPVGLRMNFPRDGELPILRRSSQGR